MKPTRTRTYGAAARTLVGTSISAAAFLFAGCRTTVPVKTSSVARPSYERIVGKARAKNVILMIGDGMGFNHVDALSLYESGKTEMQLFEWFPFTCAMSTYMTGQSYTPDTVWEHFLDVADHRAGRAAGVSREEAAEASPPYSRYTDSAAAATAMTSGIKTYKGAIGLDRDQRAVETLVETAHGLGKATGVVTSVQLSHATPASFAAHTASRNSYAEIAQQMLYESPLDVVMGAGHPLHDDSGEARSLKDKATVYVGGPDAWKDMSDGRLDGLATAGVGDHTAIDYDADGVPDRPVYGPWAVVQDRTSFGQLSAGRDMPGERVVGVARAASTLQQRRVRLAAGGETVDRDADAPFRCKPNPAVPLLTTMSRGALNVLRTRDDDGAGFFLMIEGGAIDWASHSNDTTRVVEEMVSFRDAVSAVCEWIEANSSWDDTLLIVTADHETGYLLGPGSGVVDGQPVWQPLNGNGPGLLPSVQWYSGNHTNSLVPFYAKGAGTAAFERVATSHDPVRGAYLDNTDIAPLIRALWGARQKQNDTVAGM